MKNGEILGIFPEGTRKGMAKNQKVKNGAAYLALKTGAELLPIGIQGDAKPFHKSTIIYGKPIDLSKYKDMKKIDENTESEVSDILKNQINQKLFTCKFCLQYNN